MIVTLTANPSLDRTIDVDAPLVRGAVQQARGVSEHPGGKGINVTRALTTSGTESTAVFPAAVDDPLLEAVRRYGIPNAPVAIDASVRSNVTLTEPDGTTTKVNMPGPALSSGEVGNLRTCLRGHAASARWVVLSGSLPPGCPPTLYADILREIRGADLNAAGAASERPRVAVDGSGEPLARAVAGQELPDLLKPNAEELASVVAETDDPEHLRALTRTFESDPFAAAEEAATLVARGAGAVLATLGAGGAVLVTADGAWLARHRPVTAVSTVGAGDSSLAGYLIADERGASPAECLRQAVAHGAAAAALAGTGLPGLAETDPHAVSLQRL